MKVFLLAMNWVGVENIVAMVYRKYSLEYELAPAYRQGILLRGEP